LTLILKKQAIIPDKLTAGKQTVAVRIPNHPIPIALMKAIKAPLLTTSANISGGLDTITALEVRQALGSKVSLIIEGDCNFKNPLL
jgi:L-threonylcarbamoyladenylate synthase